MNNRIEISVIIPTYNRATTLPRTLDSILNQTLQDLEVIVVDDGSTASTPELLSRYTKRDKRISVITQKNQGPSTARNNGVNEASSKYIAFMDSDDACAINRINKLQDPVIVGTTLDEILSIAQSIPLKDRIIIYRGIRFFIDVLSSTKSISSRDAKYYILGMLSDNQLIQKFMDMKFKGMNKKLKRQIS